MRPISLAHLVDAESKRLGLESWEVINIIESHLEQSYRRSGRTVSVRIDPTTSDDPINAIEMRETLTGTIWVRVENVRRPQPDVLQREIELYVKSKEGNKAWWLSLCTILAVEPDHYLVEFSKGEGPDESVETAILPKNRAGSGLDSAVVGDRRWAVLKNKHNEKFDGAEAWQQIECKYQASRTDSIFLRLLVKKYWHIDVTAEIRGAIGMVIVPADGPAGEIIGPNGSYIAQLKELAGLRRITVVRSVANHRADHRIAAAVRQITGLEFVKIRAPKPDTDVWRIYVKDQKEAARLIGVNGTNLRFIATATGFNIQHSIWNPP